MSKHPIDRRSFCMAGLTAAAGLAISPSLRAQSGEGASRPALDRLNLALIGCGNRSTVLVQSIPADVNLVAVVDPIREKREGMARDYNAVRGDTHCRPYRDFREVIGSAEIDGIIVATPDHWHVPVALEAARCGKDMYVEKPLGVSLHDQFRLRRLFEGKELIFQYGTQQRSSLFARTAVDLVRNGYIGEVRGVDVWSPSAGWDGMGPFTEEEQSVPDGLDYDLFVGPSKLLPFHPQRVTTSASWHSYNYAIGFIAGWGAHPLDICQWGLEMDHSGPTHYEGTGVLPHPQALFNTTRAWDIQCRYANGVRMRFMDGETAKPIVSDYSRFWRDDGTVFKGSEGWVQYSRGAIYLFRNGEYEPAAKFRFRDSDRRAYASNNQMRNFTDCMRSRRATINPLESAIRSDAISHLSDIVARTGKSIQWDPETEKMVDGASEQVALLDRPKREPYVF